jgi:serine/threonine-protein kinase
VAAERGDLVPPETYRPDLPPAVGTVVTRALAPRPLDRYTSAAEMGHALVSAAGDPASTLATDLPTAPYPEAGHIAEQRSWPSRRSLVIGAGVVLVLCLLAAAAQLWPRGNQRNVAAPAPSTTAPAPSVPLTTLPPAPATSTPTTEAPTTVTTPVPSAISCQVLRAERQALQRRLAQIDKTEKSSAGREAANQAIGSQQHAIEQMMHQFCG